MQKIDSGVLDWRDELEAQLEPSTVRERNYLMSRFTTMRVGGPVDLYVEPSSVLELKRILSFCVKNNVPSFLVGRGSNLIVRDGGIRGVVYTLKNSCFTQVEQVGNRLLLRAGAGAMMRSIAQFALLNKLGGLEFMDGIPGTLGGGLRMNAGAFKTCLFDVLETVSVLDKNGEVREIAASDIPHSYRDSSFFSTVIALSADLKPYVDSEDSIREKIDSMRKKRQETQALSPSAGCVFKNPNGFSAGQLIDEVGLKGYSVGGAQVSDRHANFLINKNKAKASDVLQLIEIVREKVLAVRGVPLETEVMIVGDNLENAKS